MTGARPVDKPAYSQATVEARAKSEASRDSRARGAGVPTVIERIKSWFTGDRGRRTSHGLYTRK